MDKIPLAIKFWCITTYNYQEEQLDYILMRKPDILIKVDFRPIIGLNNTVKEKER
jgi:hypothetical protein